jgi:hypothetical protein
MAGQAGILDSPEQRARELFAGEGRHPGRCASSAFALPWAPACAGKLVFGEVDR